MINRCVFVDGQLNEKFKQIEDHWYIPIDAKYGYAQNQNNIEFFHKHANGFNLITNSLEVWNDIRCRKMSLIYDEATSTLRQIEARISKNIAQMYKAGLFNDN